MSVSVVISTSPAAGAEKAVRQVCQVMWVNYAHFSVNSGLTGSGISTSTSPTSSLFGFASAEITAVVAANDPILLMVDNELDLECS